MITGPFIDLTILCIGILALGLVATAYLAATISYPYVKRQRVTTPKRKDK